MGKLSAPLSVLIARVAYHAAEADPVRLLAGLTFDQAPTQRILESKNLPHIWCDIPDFRSQYASPAGRNERIENAEIIHDFRLSTDRKDGITNTAGTGLVNWAEKIADAMNTKAEASRSQDVTLDGTAARAITVQMVEGAAFEKTLEITLRVTILSKPFTANSRKT